MDLININEANYTYDLNCVACHAANETPEFLYASFSNILRGALWVPGDKDPPNGIYKLTQGIACHWSVIEDNFVFTYDPAIPNSRLAVSWAPGIFVFTDVLVPNCEFNFINDHVAPAGVKYYGGEGLVSWVEPPKQNSLATLCELLNIPTDGLTDCLVYPVQPAKQVVNMLRGTHQTKILIKQDFA